MTPQMEFFIRCIVYVLELMFIWFLVYGETGFWTCIMATLLTAELEYQHGRRRGWWEEISLSDLKQIWRAMRDR